MPIYSSVADLKARGESWIDIDDFEIFYLGKTDEVTEPDAPPYVIPDAVEDAVGCFKAYQSRPGGRHIVPRYPKERLVVLSGEVTWEDAHQHTIITRKGWIDLPPGGGIVRNALPNFSSEGKGSAELIRISGHWAEVGWMGVWAFGPGYPCDYHYHDADEYWLVHRGHFNFLLDGVETEVGPGSFLACGMGEEHGVRNPWETLEGVGFGTQLEGQKRRGHLHRSADGIPVKTRVSKGR